MSISSQNKCDKIKSFAIHSDMEWEFSVKFFMFCEANIMNFLMFVWNVLNNRTLSARA